MDILSQSKNTWFDFCPRTTPFVKEKWSVHFLTMRGIAVLWRCDISKMGDSEIILTMKWWFIWMWGLKEEREGWRVPQDFKQDVRREAKHTRNLTSLLSNHSLSAPPNSKWKKAIEPRDESKMKSFVEWHSHIRGIIISHLGENSYWASCITSSMNPVARIKCCTFLQTAECQCFWT